MEIWTKLVEMVAGGLPAAAAKLCPEHLRKAWSERLADHNPFKAISANHDLVRATRLAWIEAAQDILKEARARVSHSGSSAQARDVEPFLATITEVLLDARDHALDRRRDPGSSPIDAHVQAVIDGVPELATPGDHPGIGGSVTAGFVTTLAALSGWRAGEIPEIFGALATAGLPTHGGGPNRPFGELVFAAFAEIIKDPKKYPQAREAFYIAMDKLGRDIGQATLDAVKGLDGKLDALIGGLNALEVLRNGAFRYLELMPKIAEDTAATRKGVKEANTKLDAQGEQLARVEALVRAMEAKQSGVPHERVVALARRIAPAVEDADTALRELERAVEIAARIEREGAAGTNLGAFVDAVLSRMAALTRKEDYAGAAEAATDAFEQWQRDEAERRDAAKAAGLKLLQAGLDADILARDAVSAARRIEQKLVLEGLTGPDLFAALRAMRTEWFHRGRDRGLNFDLSVALEIARVTSTRAASGSEKGAASTDVGISLGTLGEREANSKLLHEAVAAFKAALEHWTREDSPKNWAATQSNLANTLRIIGERENAALHLEEATSACLAALSVLSRESSPYLWAATQNNLGNVLARLGENDDDTLRIEQSTEAFREALGVWTRIGQPSEEARARANLSNSLKLLGERNENPTILKESIDGYRSALTKCAREGTPLEWAMIQNNLGSALLSLGVFESGTDRLEEAVTTYDAALEERTRERVPLDWAKTFGYRGLALGVLAERRGDLALARQALEQIEAAHAVFAAAGHAPNEAFTREQAEIARALVARLEGR